MDIEDLLIAPIEGCAAALAEIRAGDTFQILDFTYGSIEHQYRAIADADKSGDLVMIATVITFPKDEAFQLKPLVLLGETRLWIVSRAAQNRKHLAMARHLAREAAPEMARV